ncbi:MAG: hypothetical protein RR558_11330 [Coprobacillus sp.]
MIFIYIIGGFLFLILSVYFLDKREKMSHDIKELKQKKIEIESTNQQLDEIQSLLDEVHEPLVKVNELSKKALNFFRR